MSIIDALNKAPTGDPFLAFLPADGEATADPQYYGFCTVNGAWIIKQYSDVTGSTRYAGGASDYQTAWANRALLSYALPFEVTA